MNKKENDLINYELIFQTGCDDNVGHPMIVENDKSQLRENVSHIVIDEQNNSLRSREKFKLLLMRLYNLGA